MSNTPVNNTEQRLAERFYKEVRASVIAKVFAEMKGEKVTAKRLAEIFNVSRPYIYQLEKRKLDK